MLWKTLLVHEVIKIIEKLSSRSGSLPMAASFKHSLATKRNITVPNRYLLKGKVKDSVL